MWVLRVETLPVSVMVISARIDTWTIYSVEHYSAMTSSTLLTRGTSWMELKRITRHAEPDTEDAALPDSMQTAFWEKQNSRS